MNRYAIVGAVLVGVIGIGGIMLLWRSGGSSSPTGFDTTQPLYPSDSGSPAATSQGGGSKEAVQAAFKNAIAPYDQDHTQVRNTVVVGEYALQVWVGDVMGGQALLKYDAAQNRWILIASIGGAFSVAGLKKEGVPQRTVLALLDGLTD